MLSNRGDNYGPAIKRDTALNKVLSSGTADLEIVHPCNLFIQFPLRVLHNSTSFWYIIILQKINV